MAIDGIFIHFLTEELKPELENYRLEKITNYRHLFQFQFYANKVRKFLTIDLSAQFTAAYLTDNKHLTTNEPSQFLANLKKHLEGGLLKQISQYLSDRVIIFDFIVYDFILGPINKQLIFELMGKHANLYLIQNQIIIDCFKKSFSVEGRHLIPNATFDFFRTDKLDAKTYQFDPILSPKQITEKYLGISLNSATFLAQQPSYPFDLPLLPTLSLDDNKVYFNPSFTNASIKSYSTLSEALDSRKIENVSLKKNYNSFLIQQLKKIDNKILTLEKQKLEALNFNTYLNAGNLIYQSGLDLNSKQATLDQIDLNPLKTLNQNAQIFFKKYAKAKRAIYHLDEQIAKQKTNFELFEDLLADLEQTDEKDVKQFNELLQPFGFKTQIVKSKKKNKPNLLTISDDDVSYYVGKNSIQNEYLVHTLADKNYYWFHLKDSSGAHVIVSTSTLTEPIIRKAAMLAAYFSKYRYSSSIPVIYTQVKFLSKINGKSGFYLKYKNEKTIYIDVDETIINSYLNAK